MAELTISSIYQRHKIGQFDISYTKILYTKFVY